MHDRIAELPRDFMEVRDTLLERYEGKNLDGLNVGRIHRYFDDAGLDVKPYIVVTPADLQDVNEVDRVSAFRGRFTGNTAPEGIYSPEMGISVVTRNTVLEDLNGPTYTEGLIIHEGAHSATGINVFLKTRGTQGYHNARSGLSLPQLDRYTGHLYEEGWADFHRGSYISRHHADGSLLEIRSTTGWHIGPEDKLSMVFNNRLTPLPFKYAKVVETGRVTTFSSALAAYTMELLMQVNPEIYPAMTASRTSVEGLRKFAKEVNELRPGLYIYLKSLGYSEEDFTRGLHTVIDVIFGGTDSLW